MIFSKIKRNNKGEITSIKIEITDTKGGSSGSATWREDNNTIPRIEFGKTENSVIVRNAQ